MTPEAPTSDRAAAAIVLSAACTARRRYSLRSLTLDGGSRWLTVATLTAAIGRPRESRIGCPSALTP